MSTDKSPTFPVKLSAGVRRVDDGRPYLMFPATMIVEGAPVSLMLFIGLSKAQRSPSKYADGTIGPAMADSESQAIGFADHMAAIEKPELSEGRTAIVRFEEASDKGPGGWKIVTKARSVDLNAFQDALAALDAG